MKKPAGEFTQMPDIIYASYMQHVLVALRGQLTTVAYPEQETL